MAPVSDVSNHLVGLGRAGNRPSVPGQSNSGYNLIMNTKHRQLLPSHRFSQTTSHNRCFRACWVYIWPKICFQSNHSLFYGLVFNLNYVQSATLSALNNASADKEFSNPIIFSFTTKNLSCIFASQHKNSTCIPVLFTVPRPHDAYL